MNAAVIYESLTGNTRRAAQLIVAALGRAGHTASAAPITDIDYSALGAADVVIVGTWTDGAVFFGQRPGRAARIKRLPVLDRKRCVVYCTYAVDPGRTLSKMQRILEERGATVVGGMALKRTRLEADVEEFVGRILDNVTV